MEPLEPAPGSRPETRRPLLMDPAGPRPSGFAPPTVLNQPAAPPGSAASAAAPSAAAAPAAAAASAAAIASPAAAAPSAAIAPSAAVAVAAATRALAATPAPAGPGPVTPTVTAAVGAPSLLAGPTGGGPSTGVIPGEAAFGPVSQVVRISVRTVSSRLDLVLPDRSTLAETLETVLELAPRTLREQAIAHGGWILRTAAGEAMPGSSTLLDHGIVDGSTLFLSGIDAADTPAAYDDVADAVADTVRTDPSAWPVGGGRTVALGAAGVFGALTCLSLLAAGPPWTAVAVALGAITVLAQVAAALLSRGAGDAGAALVAGLLSVATGTAAAAVATAGSAEIMDVGAPQLLLGAAAATVFALTASLAIGTRRVPFAAIISGSVLVGAALTCGVIFELAPTGVAAIIAGTALSLMAVVPNVSLRLAGFEVNPLPGTADEVYADQETVDPPAVRYRTRQAVGYVTALIQGLTWPTLAACVILAFSYDFTAQVLAGIAGAGLLLRARLFVRIGQRLPLLIAGIGSIVALLAALMLEFDSPTVLAAATAPALLGVIGCLLLAGRSRRVSPVMVRTAEITELLIAIAVVPLVAGVLGLFGFIRGLGG